MNKTRCITLLFSLLFAILLFANKKKEVSVLQWNIWQEGTSVKGGYEAIINELVRLKPDFVTFSEVRNYHGVDFIARVINDLKKRGLTYYGQRSKDTGLLSHYPIKEFCNVFPLNNDHGTIHRLVAQKDHREFAVYTAHLDYLDDAYYNVKGYDGSTWKEIVPDTDINSILKRNALSKRDEAMAAFLTMAQKDLEAGRIVFLGGDFNEPSFLDWTPQTCYLFDRHGVVITWPQTKALDDAHFKDSYRICYPNPITHPGITYPSDNPDVSIHRLSWAPLADERERIDYIFFNGEGIRITSCKLFGPEGTIRCYQRTPNRWKEQYITPLGVWPSDHKGLWATFEYD